MTEIKGIDIEDTSEPGQIVVDARGIQIKIAFKTAKRIGVIMMQYSLSKEPPFLDVAPDKFHEILDILRDDFETMTEDHIRKLGYNAQMLKTFRYLSVDTESINIKHQEKKEIKRTRICKFAPSCNKKDCTYAHSEKEFQPGECVRGVKCEHFCTGCRKGGGYCFCKCTYLHPGQTIMRMWKKWGPRTYQAPRSPDIPWDGSYKGPLGN